MMRPKALSVQEMCTCAIQHFAWYATVWIGDCDMHWRLDLIGWIEALGDDGSSNYVSTNHVCRAEDMCIHCTLDAHIYIVRT